MELIASILLTLLVLSILFLSLSSKLTSATNGSPTPPALPLLGHLHLFMLRGTPLHIRLTKLSQRYGPNILSLRFGAVPVFIASSRDAAREFLKTHDSVFASRPDTSNNRHLALDSDLIAAPYGERWKRLRKLVVSELLTARTVESFRETRLGEVKSLCTSLRALDSSVCMRDMLKGLTFNIITQMLMNKRYYSYGKSNGCDQACDVEAANFLELMDKLFEMAGEFPVSDYLPALRSVDPVRRRLEALGKSLHEFCDGIFREHEARFKSLGGGDGTVRTRCFMDSLITLLHEEGGEDKFFDRSHVNPLIMDMLLAGTDTSALTLEWALAEMIKNPDVRLKVQEEIEAVVGKERLVEEVDLPKLSYLKAVVKEVFRLHPVAPLLFPHMAVESRNVMGVSIPAGATLIVNMHVVSRDEKVWAEPERFWPERFMESRVDVRGQDFELLPFGAGRRMCPGLALGLTMVELALANLVHAFEWEAPPGEEIDTVTEAFGLAMTMARPLRAVATPRLTPCLTI